MNSPVEFSVMVAHGNFHIRDLWRQYYCSSILSFVDHWLISALRGIQSQNAPCKQLICRLSPTCRKTAALMMDEFALHSVRWRECCYGRLSSICNRGAHCACRTMKAVYTELAHMSNLCILIPFFAKEYKIRVTQHLQRLFQKLDSVRYRIKQASNLGNWIKVIPN